MSDENNKATTIAELEAQIARRKAETDAKRAALESPFVPVGAAPAAERKRGPGRPPGSVNKPKVETPLSDDGEDSRIVAHKQKLNEVSRPPSNSSAESMREWADQEVHKLIPDAMASLAWDTRYGDQKARAEARAEVFRMAGIDRKDAGQFVKGGQIVINLGADGMGANQGINLPFLQRRDGPSPINSTQNNPTPSNPVLSTLEDKVNAKKSKSASAGDSNDESAATEPNGDGRID